TSGKIQRSACRQRFVDGGFTPVAQWHAPPPAATPKGPRLNFGKLADAMRNSLQQQRSQRD
ncbi:hypothetical protein, partial [Mycolicibacter sinensis]|uniref:hypothetical protein n=1 Tax=Mycolicibacter sinensis (strain JDM601) TaxID=875328 RepID=UPI000A89FC49